MKTLINYRNIAIAFVTMFTLALTPASHATDDKNNVSVELKFLGNFRSQPVFELSILNPGTEKEFIINIRDENGNSLYREVVNSTMISKKFLLNTEDIGDDRIRFEITGKKNNKTVVYEVNQNTRFVEETLVTKVSN